MNKPQPSPLPSLPPGQAPLSPRQEMKKGLLLMLAAVLVALIFWVGLTLVDRLSPTGTGETGVAVVALVLGMALLRLSGFLGVGGLIVTLIGVGRALRERTTNEGV